MQDVVGSSTGSRIKILSAGLPAARDATPLAQIPLGDGVRTAAELRLTKHTNLDAKDAAACEVILLQSVYKKVNEHLREDTAREHGGFLYGYESTFGQDNTPVVVVTDAIPAKFTEGTPVRLIFTMETWRELDDEVVRRYGEAQGAPQQVGWYHSHPNIRIFLSSWDLDVCTTYERRRYPLALVADPINDKGGCFVGGAKGYDPRSPQGFYEAHDLRDDASVVTWKNVSQRTDLAVAPTERRMRAEGVEMEIQSAGKRALAAPKPLKIKIPWAKRVDTLLARVGYALVVVLLLGVIGYLAATQIRQQRDIVKLQQASQQHTSTPTASQTTAPPEETHEPVPGQTVASSVKTPSGSSSSGPKSGGVQAAALPPAKPTVSVSPHDVTLEASKTHRFQTTIQGPAKDRKVGVRWSLLPSGLGTVDPNGVYTAPKAIADNATVKVIATSIANPKVRDQWTVMLVKSLQTSTAKSSANGASGSEAAGKDPADSKAAAGNDAPSPPAPAFKVVGETMLMEGKSVTFKAELGGQPVKATWSMAPGSVGKLSEADGDGSYTAPDSVNTETTVKIVAHKADDATVTDTLTLTIKPHGTAKIDRNREGAGQETDAGRVTVMEKAQALNRGARRV